jgi:hypothetical protein
MEWEYRRSRPSWRWWLGGQTTRWAMRWRTRGPCPWRGDRPPRRWRWRWESVRGRRQSGRWWGRGRGLWRRHEREERRRLVWIRHDRRASRHVLHGSRRAKRKTSPWRYGCPSCPFCALLRPTARHGLRNVSALLRHQKRGIPSLILVAASSTSPATSCNSDWRSDNKKMRRVTNGGSSTDRRLTTKGIALATAGQIGGTLCRSLRARWHQWQFCRTWREEGG